MSQPSHILVTGGAGFIGSHLVERLLLEEKKSVVVIDDLSTGSLENLSKVKGHPDLRIIQSKVSECVELEDLAANAESIFHLAAAVGVELVVKEPVRTIETNLRETQAILNAAHVAHTPVLVASTSEVYGKSQAAAFSETDDLLIGPPHLARWSYACSKLMDEFLALAHTRENGLPITIVRLFNTVGPRQTGRWGMVLPRFIASALAGTPIHVYGDGLQSRCFCYVLDTVEALVRLQNCPAGRGEVFNIGSDQEISVLDLAKLVVNILDSKSTIEMIPYSQAYTEGFEDMRRRKPVVEKLARTIGYAPKTPLVDVIRLTALHMARKS